MTETIFKFSDGSTHNSPDTTLTSSSYSPYIPAGGSLTEVQVGTIVESIGDYCFYERTSLTTVTFDAESRVTSIGNGCFENCSGLTSIIIPTSVETLGSGAFQICTSLETVTFDADSIVTSIGDYCFNYCSGLTSIIIPTSVQTLGSNAFAFCTILETVTFDAGSIVTSIGYYCFYSCSGLTSITIPSLVNNIGSRAFYDCTNLITFTFDNQNTLTSVGTSTFNNDPAMSVTYYNTANEANLSTASASLKSQFPSGSTYTYNAGPSCFNKGTNILTEKGYVRIEDLKKGDLVKTYLHGYKEITKIGKGFGKNNNANKLLNMHIYENVNFEEPLIMTGGHSILVDDLRIYKEENEKWFRGNTYKIDDKYLLLATVSNDFVEIKDGSEFEYYHLVLENEDENGQYGIWANNVLTESASMKWFVKECLKELSEM